MSGGNTNFFQNPFGVVPPIFRVRAADFEDLALQFLVILIFIQKFVDSHIFFLSGFWDFPFPF
jgi:hypothetical protein